MVNVSAYGPFGPYRDQIGYDPIGQTMPGIAMVTGEQGMPPIRAGVPVIDRTTALHTAIGTLAAMLSTTQHCDLNTDRLQPISRNASGVDIGGKMR